MPADEPFDRWRAGRLPTTERAPHEVGRTPSPYSAGGVLIAVGCHACGKWIFHEARHGCELTDDERRDRDAWRGSKALQLRYMGVAMAVEP